MIKRRGGKCRKKESMFGSQSDKGKDSRKKMLMTHRCTKPAMRRKDGEETGRGGIFCNRGKESKKKKGGQIIRLRTEKEKGGKRTFTLGKKGGG